MLAFNLGVFFRNLKGEEVVFSAETPQCQVNFTGGVADLHEETTLTRRLSVTLAKANLSLSISFEENEEVEPEDTEVEVVMLQTGKEGDLQLLRTTFRFGDISLKPISELKEGEQPAITSGPPEDDGPELA